jgi:hypothetical protein
MNGLGEDHQAAEALLQGNSRDPGKLFDPRAVIILEEAIGLGALPQFSLASAQPLDLRHVPPCTAEVLARSFTRLALSLSLSLALPVAVPGPSPYQPCHLLGRIALDRHEKIVVAAGVCAGDSGCYAARSRP